MTFQAKSLLHLKPTYELVTSKVLFSLGYSVAVVGVSLYLVELGLSDAQIGIFTGTIALLIAALSLKLPPLLERFNQRRLLIGSSVLAAVSLAGIGFANVALAAILLLALTQIAMHINSSALSVLFKDSTRSRKEYTQDIGLLGSFTNLGWFIGPLIGGLVLTLSGFKGIFLLGGAFALLGGLYVLLFPFKTLVKQRTTLDTRVRDNLKFYLSNPQLRIAYLQRLGIDFWWGFVWTFTPILMIRGGYSAAAIGLFIGLTQLPLFLFEFKTVGFVAKLGFKRIFTTAYILLAVVSILALIMTPISLPITLGLVLLGSLALCFLEPISDLFFFSQVSLLEEEKAYPTYATAAPIGSMLARILPGFTLLLLHDQGVFLAACAVMGFIAFKAFSVKEVAEA